MKDRRERDGTDKPMLLGKLEEREAIGTENMGEGLGRVCDRELCACACLCMHMLECVCVYVCAYLA